MPMKFLYAMIVHFELTVSPHHMIFFGDFEKYGKNEIKNRTKAFKRLNRTFAKGIVISVNHSNNMTWLEPQLLCILCDKILKSFDMNRANAKELTWQLDLTTNSNFQKRKIQLSEWPNVESMMNSNCDFANPEFRPAFPTKNPLLCIYHVLLPSYNVTTKSPGAVTDRSTIIIQSTSYYTIYNDTYKMNMRYGWRIISHLFRTFPLRYTAFQKSPAFSTAELSKPYDWKSWLAWLTTLTILAHVFSMQTFPTNIWRVP